MSFYFAHKSWPEIDEYIKKNAVIILPVGTTEEHGHHLPVACDALIAEKFGHEIGKALDEKGVPVLVMETIQYGFSMGIVRSWPGCPNIDTRTFADYIFNICSSLVTMGFKRIVMLDCHGNHDCLLRLVMREIVDKYDTYMMTLSPSSLTSGLYKQIRKDPEGDIHGGEWETSVILAIDEKLVHTDKYTNVDAIRCNSKLRGPVSTWGLQKTSTGLFGDPTYATKELGEAMVKEGTERGVEYIEEYYNYKFE